ncbi:diadenylate cyclase [Halobium palmae]|uniref:Diadenylate cyclase n=1 Tax=Halobium palmae TaxID=1776492 RepID=A0ABD5RUZ2_9EURY
MIDVIRFCVETISIEFDGWAESHDHGPGLYFAVVCGGSVQGYADTMGDERWPVDSSEHVLADISAFYEAAKEVSRTRDGAVVVSVDGVVLSQMVRFRNLPSGPETGVDYEDWMGSRHMSALDTSTRDEVIVTITLSGENGRVSVFEDGGFTTERQSELDRRWDPG